MKYIFLSVLFLTSLITIPNVFSGNLTRSINSNAGEINILEDQNNSSSEKPVLLTRETFLKTIWDYTNSPKEWKYKGQKPAIIDFYADWCGPCRIASPILEEISKEYSGKIEVYKINTDKEKELASVFGVTGIPAFLYIPVNGKPVMSSGIARSSEETKSMFIEFINKYLLNK